VRHGSVNNVGSDRGGTDICGTDICGTGTFDRTGHLMAPGDNE
jgi:hypothetical protein